MNKYLLLVLSILFYTVTLGHNDSRSNTFVLKGQITNYPSPYMILYYETRSGTRSADTIQLKKDGTFQYTTKNIITPSEATFNGTSIFVAPGYRLHFTADGIDQLTFVKSKAISGEGAESNRYNFQLDSIDVANIQQKSFYELDANSAVKAIEYHKMLRDSLAHVVFDKASAKDKYISYFGKLSRLNNQFLQLNRLVTYLTLNVHDYSTYNAFIEKNFDNNILENLFSDDNYVSSEYRSLMVNSYVNYLVYIDYGKDSSLRKNKNYSLEKISSVYSGKIKDYALFAKLNSLVEFESRSIKALNKNKKIVEIYLPTINNTSFQTKLEKSVNAKEILLITQTAGKPAPTFIAESNTGKTYSLSDFKGKVVYLDLWASWCHPCREQTPYLAQLHEQYKTNSDIASVSISLDEDREKWKKALQEDKPTWLQLLDKGQSVQTGYVANVIPQFIIIDKNGNIVNFNAPIPSKKTELEKILNEQLVK